MRVRIVLATQNAGWVIGKMGHRLSEHLRLHGVDATVADRPDPGADINHWMSFAFADGCAGTVNTMFVTHPDDPFKIKLIRDRLEADIQLALCMSPYAVEELRTFGIARDRLWHVLPAIDRPLQARRIRVGITTRVYDDGRKRERFLVSLAERMRLDAFQFSIFGEGWQPTIVHLRRAGAQVDYDPGSDDWQGDYARIQDAIPGLDYYLYLGMDEGSLGTLDAASAGVRTIVTAQGFHLALPGGITHPFTAFEDLEAIFRRLAAEHRAPTQAYEAWSWAAYAQEHLHIWQAMLRHRGASVPEAELAAATAARAVRQDAQEFAGKIASRDLRFYLRVLEPKRIRGAIARLRWLQPLRRLIGR